MICWEAVEDFLDFGVIAPGEDFLFPNTRQIHPAPSFVPLFHPKEKDLHRAAELVHGIFLESLEQTLKSPELQHFALSGGCDTRLILAALITHFPNSLKKLRIYSRVHPKLTAETDRDALTAKALASHFGFEIHLEKPEFHPQFYLRPMVHSEGLTLTGLFGGEFLGGQISKLVPKRIQNLREYRKSSSLRKYLERFGLENSGQLNVIVHLCCATEALGIYENPFWFRPRSFQSVARSPFFNTHFLEVFNIVESRLFKDYLLYAEILKRFYADFLQIPVNNEAISRHGIPQAHSGREPKQIATQTPNETEKTDLGAEELEILSYVRSQSQRQCASLMARLIPHGVLRL